MSMGPGGNCDGSYDDECVMTMREFDEAIAAAEARGKRESEAEWVEGATALGGNVTEEEERARCEEVVRHCTSSIGLVDLNSAEARRVLVPMAIQLRAEAFEAGRKSRDGEVADMNAGHDNTHANLVRVADLLATCKAKLARVEAAARNVAGRSPEGVNASRLALDTLRASLSHVADSGEKPKAHPFVDDGSKYGCRSCRDYMARTHLYPICACGRDT